jgi:hypothetical protein
MRRLLQGLAAIAIISAPLGCQTIDPNTASALKASWDVIAPEYISYVKGDPSLLPDQVERRRVHVEEHTQLLEILTGTGGEQ